MSATPSLENALGQFPVEVTTDDGSTVEVRVFGPEDREAVLAFARNLPEQDLLFLRVDITRDDAVDHWLDNVRAGITVSLVAYCGDTVVGYATVDRNPARWTRRVGELRVNVAPELRSKGLGRQLTAKIFDVAHSLGLKKVIANMTPDQRGARAAFQRLGFVAEALLADFVEDRSGRSHDLVIMSYDVDGLTDQADAPLHV